MRCKVCQKPSGNNNVCQSCFNKQPTCANCHTKKVTRPNAAYCKECSCCNCTNLRESNSTNCRDCKQNPCPLCNERCCFQKLPTCKECFEKAPLCLRDGCKRRILFGTAVYCAQHRCQTKDCNGAPGLNCAYCAGCQATLCKHCGRQPCALGQDACFNCRKALAPDCFNSLTCGNRVGYRENGQPYQYCIACMCSGKCGKPRVLETLFCDSCVGCRAVGCTFAAMKDYPWCKKCKELWNKGLTKCQRVDCPRYIPKHFDLCNNCHS